MPKRIIISGAIAGRPWFGGHAWAYLNYLLGFRRLNFDTYYVEYLRNEDCVDDIGTPSSFDQCSNVRYFRTIMDRFGLAPHAALLEQDGAGHVGLSQDALEKLACETELLINLGGRAIPESVFGAVGKRIYIDLDPGYTQIWREQYGAHMNLDGHDLYVTVGLNLGKPDCPFPTCGLKWETTLPPVVLNEWRTTNLPGRSYTTIAEWRGFSPVEWQGVWYGQKVDEFLRLIELPRRVSAPLELCLDIYANEPDRPKLEENGWKLTKPRDHASFPESYRNYLFESRGEFTAVKHTYVAGRTAWFSDRSACYLAAGRPVIIQDTGIGAYVPTGTGLLTFSDIETAAYALNQVEQDYKRHAAAASDFAREYLDSDRVLRHLLQLAAL